MKSLKNNYRSSEQRLEKVFIPCVIQLHLSGPDWSPQSSLLRKTPVFGKHQPLTQHCFRIYGGYVYKDSDSDP